MLCLLFVLCACVSSVCMCVSVRECVSERVCVCVWVCVGVGGWGCLFASFFLLNDL